MTETYCGKNCAECMRKEALACPGCKAGPGKAFGGDCEIAKCMRSKGHETCGSCAFYATCRPRSGRDSMPDNRIRKIEVEGQRKALMAKRAPVLGKGLWILFWLVILRVPVGLLTNGSIVGVDTPVAMAGQLLLAAMSLAAGAVFWKMAAEEPRYRWAGLCIAAAAVLNLVLELIPGMGEAVFLLLSIPVAVVGLVGEYNEYKAHAAVLAGVDNGLCEKWETLWKWYIGLFALMFASLLVMLLIPVFGVLLILAATIGVLVVSILKLVYLYRTARLFRSMMV